MSKASRPDRTIKTDPWAGQGSEAERELHRMLMAHAINAPATVQTRAGWALFANPTAQSFIVAAIVLAIFAVCYFGPPVGFATSGGL